MKLQLLSQQFTVCKLKSAQNINPDGGILFYAVTDEEISLVCETVRAPSNTLEREDGWRGFRITGTLDFSLIGILSEISAILADNNIGIFVVSTYNTDYILVKEQNIEKAVKSLSEKGYDWI